MLKRIQLRKSLAVLGACALMALGVSGTAQANHEVPHCSDGWICLYNNTGHSGCPLYQQTGDQDLRDDFPCGGSDPFNDNASSAKNKKSHMITLCRNVFFGGDHERLSAGATPSNLALDNDVSSVANEAQYCPN